MGRKIKRGIDYFPMDVTFFSDIKIRKLIRYQGGKAVSVYAHLLCNIYANGYYLVWDDELPFVISEGTGFDEAYIQEVIKNCLNIGLFSKSMFENHKILTSRGIQERYEYINNKLLKKLTVIDEYNMLESENQEINSEFMTINSEEMPINSEEKNASSKNIKKMAKNTQKNTKFNEKSSSEKQTQNPINSEEMPINSEEMPINSEEMPINSEESTQKKRKEIKGNKKEEKNTKKETLSEKIKNRNLDFVSPEFSDCFFEYLDFRKLQHNFEYSSESFVKTAYNDLIKLSENNPQTAKLIVEQSIVKGWKGLFELRGNQNGYANNGNANGTGKRISDYEKRRQLSTDDLAKSRELLLAKLQNADGGFGN